MPQPSIAKTDETLAVEQALRDCKSAAEVHAVADLHKPHVKALARLPETRVHAIHLSNLKAVKLKEFRDGG